MIVDIFYSLLFFQLLLNIIYGLTYKRKEYFYYSLYLVSNYAYSVVYIAYLEGNSPFMIEHYKIMDSLIYGMAIFPWLIYTFFFIQYFLDIREKRAAAAIRFTRFGISFILFIFMNFLYKYFFGLTAIDYALSLLIPLSMLIFFFVSISKWIFDLPYARYFAIVIIVSLPAYMFSYIYRYYYGIPYIVHFGSIGGIFFTSITIVIEIIIINVALLHKQRDTDKRNIYRQIQLKAEAQKNKKLHESLIKMKDLSESRNYFLTHISAELQKPFFGFNDLARELNQHIKAKQYDVIEEISFKIDYSAVQINLLLENLLQWSMIRKKIPERYPIFNPIEEKIKSITSEFSNDIGIQLTKFEFFLNDASIAVFSDAKSLDIIFRNIIVYILKSTSIVGKSTIKINIKKQDNKVAVCFTRYAPINLSFEEIERIQQVFESPNIPEVEASNIDLGLWLIATEIKLNQGRVVFNIIPHQYIEFIVELPSV